MSSVAYCMCVCLCVFAFTRKRDLGFGGVLTAGGWSRSRRRRRRGVHGSDGSPRVVRPALRFESAAGRWTADTGTRRKYKVE